MKIAIESRALTAQSAGVKRYVQNLTQELPRTAPQHNYYLVKDAPQGELMLPLWLNWTLPRRLNQIKPDVVHYTKAAVPFDFAQGKPHIPIVVTIYDLIPILFPQSQKPLPRLLWPAALRHAARTADHIITISEASKHDIVEHLQADPAKITVTPLAIDPIKFSSEKITDYQLPITKPYILWLGTLEPRKNIPALIRAFAQITNGIPHHLILAGRISHGFDDVQHEITKHNLTDRVQHIGHVEESSLVPLYQHADLFIYPSINEGWGFPPQEAIACGTPALVSSGGSLPEVVGTRDAVVSFTADSLTSRLHDEGFEKNLAHAIRDLLTNKQKAQALLKVSQRHIQQFTWSRVASSTLAVYNQVA